VIQIAKAKKATKKAASGSAPKFGSPAWRAKYGTGKKKSKKK
jgi:hypothetical protein